MTRLDDYSSALLAAYPGIADAKLSRALDTGGPVFVSFIANHGLGPLWHERTRRIEFDASRMSAEALYLAQDRSLGEIDTLFEKAGIDYVLIKGVANRLLLFENPAIRACYDIDLVVRPEDRVQAAALLVDNGFIAGPVRRSISREITLSKGAVDVDLHWGLLREGRLRNDCVANAVARRRRVHNLWMPSAEDALFLLLVHPAFAQHLAGWGMGLHRVVDIVDWVRTQSFDWPAVRTMLEQNGVRSAAWATLRWVQLLTGENAPDEMDVMMADVQPSRLRRRWLSYWLRNDLSTRLADNHWARLIGLSPFLHDTPADVIRALAGRQRARRRREEDLVAFSKLSG